MVPPIVASAFKAPALRSPDLTWLDIVQRLLRRSRRALERKARGSVVPCEPRPQSELVTRHGRLDLEGNLVGPWVAEFEKAWWPHSRRSLALDLSEVRHLDSAGKSLLAVLRGRGSRRWRQEW